MSASELDQNEREAFLQWRRSLAGLQEMDGIVMTPYEKNLDFWRQLWRVIERSDVIVQIVDARNPLLFYCPDLITYVKEVDENKVSLVLINKADYLDEAQRQSWADYFTEAGVRVAFWSALAETERQQKSEDASDSESERINDESSDEDDDDDDDDTVDMEDNSVDTKGNNSSDLAQRDCEGSKMDTDDSVQSKSMSSSCSSSQQHSNLDKDKNQSKSFQRSDLLKDTESMSSSDSDGCKGDTDKSSVTITGQLNPEPQTDSAMLESDTDKTASGCSKFGHVSNVSSKLKNSSDIHTGPGLVEWLKNLHQDVTATVTDKDITVIGMVGYPNVGKSSTINALLQMKKVPVSAQPGRTKHFQTLYLDSSLMLCDCPGLVFPSFVNTKADLVVSGILPIDQMRDYIPPISLVCELMGRGVLSKTYGLLLPQPEEGEDPFRPPTAHELLHAYGAMRGYMTSKGIPDGPRSSRYILKDYVNGKLLYCHPPPSIDGKEFNKKILEVNNSDSTGSSAANKQGGGTVPMSKVDQEFFRKVESKIHSRSTGPILVGAGPATGPGSKPWKRHNNRNKKEKLRRVYGHHDN